jgi:hypothetical protein
MTAGRWTPNIATRRHAERTSVIFEFALSSRLGIRSSEGDGRWGYGRVDLGRNSAA